MKVWGGMMIIGGEQRRVFMGETIKAFRARTGIARDWMADTSNPDEVKLGTESPEILWVRIDRLGQYFVRAPSIQTADGRSE